MLQVEKHIWYGKELDPTGHCPLKDWPLPIGVPEAPLQGWLSPGTWMKSQQAPVTLRAASARDYNASRVQNSRFHSVMFWLPTFLGGDLGASPDSSCPPLGLGDPSGLLLSGEGAKELSSWHPALRPEVLPGWADTPNISLWAG